MAKIWKLKPKASEEFLKEFSEYNPLILQLLFNRGIVEREEIINFLNPDYEKLFSPFLFKDMEKAVKRIWQAIENKEKICIYGDYDADAVTANAVLQHAFRYLGVEVESYIPDRFAEGYGVNLDALSKIKDKGSKIIITVDCGANSVEAAEYCASNGIDLIITDHHEIIGVTPKAFALVNPKNPEDKYPYHEITGVGVAFKLACGVLSNFDKVSSRISNHPASLTLGTPPFKGGEYRGGYEKWLLDLVAIGTVADCHSLLGENRVLVKFGLKVLPKSRWKGLRALCRTAGLDFTQKLPDTYTLGFIIAPRINAAGRLEHANRALDLLMSDEVASLDHATYLESVNKRRQDITADILDQVDKDFNKEENLESRLLSEIKERAELIADRKIIVLMGENWHRGVVGLVAGRLAQDLNRPVIILEKGEEESTGSARSIGDFDILEAIKSASIHLTRFGGHKQAAGLTLRTKEYEQFYQKLLDYAERHLKPEDLEKSLELEAELDQDQLDLKTYKMLAEFEPFGVSNPKPKFLINSMKITGLREVGTGQKHLQLQLQKDLKNISAIAFNMGYLAKSLKIGDNIDVAAELIEDGWNGRADVKLRVVDIKAKR